MTVKIYLVTCTKIQQCFFHYTLEFVIVITEFKYRVKLAYNEELGTGHFCSLWPDFVITGLIHAVKWLIKPSVRYKRVRYNQVSL